MSWTLIPPGRRHPGTTKENKFWYAVITVRGQRREISTHTRDKGLAGRFAKRAERDQYERSFLGAGEAKTLARAIEGYIGFRRPGANDRRYLDALKRWMGHLKVDGISQQDFDQAALALYPGRSPETWNRHVYTPLQAVLRHAGYARPIKRPKQKKPRNRSLKRPVADLLIANADDADLSALLTLLFYTGCRIGEAIALTPERLDFNGRRICFYLGKTDEDHWRPMHEKVFVALANLPKHKNRIFRWRTTSGPRKPLRALCKRLGLTMTPHMARHSYATWLTDNGMSLKDLKDAGGWADLKSVMRYIGGDVERVRKAVDKL